MSEPRVALILVLLALPVVSMLFVCVVGLLDRWFPPADEGRVVPGRRREPKR